MIFSVICSRYKLKIKLQLSKMTSSLQSCLDAVDEFVNILCEKFELEDIENIVDEFKKSFSEKPEFLTVKKIKKVKAKKGEASTSKEVKEPTFYRIFSDYEKKNNTDLSEKSFQKEIREIWENSEKGKYIYSRCVEIKKKSRKQSNIDIFNIVIEEWNHKSDNNDEDNKNIINNVEYENEVYDDENNSD